MSDDTSTKLPWWTKFDLPADLSTLIGRTFHFRGEETEGGDLLEVWDVVLTVIVATTRGQSRIHLCSHKFPAERYGLTKFESFNPDVLWTARDAKGQITFLDK